MTVSDYATSFGYKSVDGTYYYLPTAAHPKTSLWVSNYHRGNDHPAPVDTPLVIGSTTLGLSGATGAAYGAHCHIQAGTDKACQNDIDPTPYEFQPGTVVTTGSASQWGNYITIQVSDKYVTYCHLNSISVKVGDKVGGTMAKNSLDSERILNHAVLGRNGLDGRPEAFTDPSTNPNIQKSGILNQEMTPDHIISLFTSTEGQNYDKWIKSVVAERDSLRAQVATLQSGSDAATKLAEIMKVLGS